ncbi:hypothetical protein [Ekhidna sp.]|jgi:hypothetical protein|uniref:hypothetical protein n=1 Tax=Ekhidna sp. TaxID=2608089 RepID=UPI0032F02BEC|tara:strand:+ start:11091 stop:12230 length:1140 start_codon:yes stop_codon:yes gene_type:complete
MMVDYIDGAIMENIQKSRVLKSKFPSAKKSSLYFESLVSKATLEIESTIQDLVGLLHDQDYSKPANLRRKFSKFKAILSKLHVLENVIVAAISRRHDDDDFANKLMREICSEIEYPTQTPVVSCLSQHYYRILPYYNLVCMPLLESDFLLHLPDLYHEICHPLISVDNPKTEVIKSSRGKLNRDVKRHFNVEIGRLQKNQFDNSEFLRTYYVWRDSWIDKWSEELFCDLFATLTLGPAYVWSNLHMCAKMDWNLFKIPLLQKSSHPPAGARMQAMFYGLDLIGFNEERKKISIKWEEFIQVIGAAPEPEYHIALPDSFLKKSAEYALEGVKGLGCTLASENQDAIIIKTLNEAWKSFWRSPMGFVDTEERIMKELKKNL